MITLIAAVANGGAIGKKGELLWHIPEDLKHFKALTMDAPVIMGRNTWESLPFRPLPGRLNIIITSQADYTPVSTSKKAVAAPTVVSSLEEAIATAQPAADAADKDIFIIGGGRVYSEALPLADALELTGIPLDAPDADTFFPPIDPSRWQLVSSQPVTVAHPVTPATHTQPTDTSHITITVLRYLRR